MTKGQIPSTGGQTQRDSSPPRALQRSPSRWNYIIQLPSNQNVSQQGSSIQNVSQQHPSRRRSPPRLLRSDSPVFLEEDISLIYTPAPISIHRNAFVGERGSTQQQGVSQHGASLPSVSQQGGSFPSMSQQGASFQGGSHYEAPRQGAVRRGATRRGATRRRASFQNGSQQYDPPQNVHLPAATRRSTSRRGTSRPGQGQNDSLPASRQRLESKAHIKTLNKEFKFAVDCLKTVLRGYSRKWCAIVSAPVADPSRDKFCTDNIKKAILHLIGNELYGEISVAYRSWFNCEEEIKHMKLQKLLQLFTTEFCSKPYSTRKFLEFCCKVAEMSALLYMKGDSFGPPYGVMCIFYAVKHAMEDNEIGEDYNPWTELDDLAERVVNKKYRHSDPMSTLKSCRELVLLETFDNEQTIDIE